MTRVHLYFTQVTENPSVTETRRRHISGGTAKTKSISEKEGRSAVTAGRKSVPVTSRKPLVGTFFFRITTAQRKHNLNVHFSRHRIIYQKPLKICLHSQFTPT